MAVPAENKISAPRGKKSAAAFRTISEVAAELELPQHVLRFWETKFPSVKPLKRGGGRRYYRPEDISHLKHIRNLLYVEGYTIKGVQKLLSKNTVNLVANDKRAEPAKKTIAPVPPTSHVSPGEDSEATSSPEAMKLGTLDLEARKTLEGLLQELEELRALLRNSAP